MTLKLPDEVPQRILPERYYCGEVGARMIQEIDALRAERDQAEADARLLARSFLSQNIVDDGSIEAWDRWRASEPRVGV